MAITIGKMIYSQPLISGKPAILTVTMRRNYSNRRENFTTELHVSLGNNSNFKLMTTSYFSLIEGKKALDVKYYPKFTKPGSYFTLIKVFDANRKLVAERQGAYPDTVSAGLTNIIGYEKDQISYLNQNNYTNTHYWIDSNGNKIAKTVSASGCGPTSMAIGLKTFGISTNPDELFAHIINKDGCYDGNNGIYTAGLIACATYKGKTAVSVYSLSSIKAALNRKNLVALGVAKSNLTSGGHVVLVYGMETRGGKEYFRIADPNKSNSSYDDRDASYLIDDVKNDGFVLIEASYIMRPGIFVQAVEICR